MSGNIYKDNLIFVVQGSIVHQEGPNTLSRHGEIHIEQLEATIPWSKREWQVWHRDILDPQRLRYMVKAFYVYRQQLFSE